MVAAGNFISVCYLLLLFPSSPPMSQEVTSLILSPSSPLKLLLRALMGCLMLGCTGNTICHLIRTQQINQSFPSGMDLGSTANLLVS